MVKQSMATAQKVKTVQHKQININAGSIREISVIHNMYPLHYVGLIIENKEDMPYLVLYDFEYGVQKLICIKKNEIAAVKRVCLDGSVRKNAEKFWNIYLQNKSMCTQTNEIDRCAQEQLNNIADCIYREYVFTKRYDNETQRSLSVCANSFNTYINKMLLELPEGLRKKTNGKTQAGYKYCTQEHYGNTIVCCDFIDLSDKIEDDIYIEDVNVLIRDYKFMINNTAHNCSFDVNDGVLWYDKHNIQSLNNIKMFKAAKLVNTYLQVIRYIEQMQISLHLPQDVIKLELCVNIIDDILRSDFTNKRSFKRCLCDSKYDCPHNSNIDYNAYNFITEWDDCCNECVNFVSPYTFENRYDMLEDVTFAPFLVYRLTYNVEFDKQVRKIIFNLMQRFKKGSKNNE